MDSFDGKVALVTGAASGIGFGIASALFARGAHVVLADIEADRLTAAAQSLSGGGGSISTLVLDVADRAAVYAAAAAHDAQFGRLDILVNNAGVAYNAKPLFETDDGAIDWSFGVNTFGVINGIKAFVPLMIRGGAGGHIVNTASIGGFQVRPSQMWHQGLYAATKYAVVALSEGLRHDLKPHGINVSILAPSQVATQIGSSDRNRPARFGSSSGAAQSSAVAEMLAGGMPPALVGERVAEAILNKEFYIFTHLEALDIVKNRHREIEAAFEDARRFLIAHDALSLG